MHHISIIGYLVFGLYLFGSVRYLMDCCSRARQEENAEQTAASVQGTVYIRTVSGVLFTMTLSHTPAQGKCTQILLDYKSFMQCSIRLVNFRLLC